MNGIALDTSAYSEMRRGVRSVVLAVERADVVYLSPVVLGELEIGFRNGSRIAENRRLIREFLSTSAVRMGSITSTTADCYATIYTDLMRVGRPIPSNDIWIAASAMEHGLVVVTFDAHFRDIPQVRSDVHVRG